MNTTRALVCGVFLSLMATHAVNATAGDYPRTATAASSSIWDPSYAIDGNVGTAWSSSYHSSGSAYEWFAFWLDTFRSTNYVRITPRTYNGGSGPFNQCVPTSIDLYYSGTDGTWHYIETVALDANITQTGYTITFPSVEANGFLLTTASLRPDSFGGYYFQIAEMNAGWQDRFFGWGNWNPSSPIAIQSEGMQTGQARQYVGCSYTSSSADCPTDGAVAFIGAGNYGALYILGDEPDQACTPPYLVASTYLSFVRTIRSYDATARFTPPVFAQPNSSCGSLHSTDYADQFLSWLNFFNDSEAAPVDEWRFHAFGQDNVSLPWLGGAACSTWDSSTWHGWIEDAASWSVAHDAPMFLGSFGFPDATGCDIVTPGWEQDMLDTVLNDQRIVGASWWSYDFGSGHDLSQSGSLTAVGTFYQSYRYR